jgi:hypothetical protein
MAHGWQLRARTGRSDCWTHGLERGCSFFLGTPAYPVGRLAFSPDGTKLASQGPLSGVVRVWALDIDDLLEIAQENVTRSLTDAECRRYLHVEACPA